MSSVPFCFGIPVVDDVPLLSGSYVLRTKNEAELSQAIQINKIRSVILVIFQVFYQSDGIQGLSFLQHLTSPLHHITVRRKDLLFPGRSV